MSRRSAPMLPPPPPIDRDVIMGPPPVPPHQPFAPSSVQNSKDPRELSEKYYKLKRKYWELEEKYKDLEDELKRSGERNVRWNSEKGMLLDRILELEAAVARQPSSPSPHSPNAHPSTQTPTAYPRTLQSTLAQNTFQANLHEALDEVRSEDPSVDPLYTSRHIGPQARKRQLEEMKEREEEEARDARKAPRRGKAATASNSSKAKDAGAPPPFTPPANPTGSPATVSASQTLIASSGKRIRLKPPAAVPPEPAPPPPPPPPTTGQGMHRIPQFINNAGVPPATHRLSPGSPMSPLGSDAEHHTVTDGDSSIALRNGNGNGNLDTPSQLGPTSPTSLAVSASSIPSTTVQRHTKPKRLKAHTVTSKSYSIPMVPRDKNGRPILPLNVGIMTVNCLGEVCMREHFHTERYIFPVGYSVNRRYLSARDPNAETVYNCTIHDGGDGPKFQIVANDMADKPIIAGTATGAWSVVVRAANHVRNRQHSNSVSGPDFFGLGQNTIKHLIQELPGADRLKDYVWQNFNEGGSGRPLGGRHATVVPALPDEYDSPNSSNGHERRGSRDSTSMDIIPDGELPISDVRGAPPPERPYSHTRRGSRNSNGGPLDDLPPISPRGHGYSPQEPAYSPRSAHRHSPREVPPPNPYSQPPSTSSHSPPPHQSPVAPPPVPAKFASIMNAYPEPPYASRTSPRSGSGLEHALGSARTRGSSTGSAVSVER